MQAPLLGPAPLWDEPPVVQAFLGEDHADDRCPQNPLYNRNEVRFGNGGVRIVDFLLLNGHDANPGSIPSGAMVDIYVKAHFLEAFDRPLVGLTISNEQGVVIYGTHSGWRGCKIAPAARGEVRVFRFRFPFSVSAGHCFIELAVARNEGDVSDVRSRVIYLSITRREVMMGLADFGAAIDDVPRQQKNVRTAAIASAPALRASDV